MKLEGKRKFLLTLLAMLMSYSLAQQRFMDAGGLITVLTLCLGMYATGNIIDKKSGGQG